MAPYYSRLSNIYNYQTHKVTFCEDDMLPSSVLSPNNLCTYKAKTNMRCKVKNSLRNTYRKVFNNTMLYICVRFPLLKNFES
jgi:hypothetical protein